MAAPKSKASFPPQAPSHGGLPPILNFTLIHAVLLQGVAGEAFVRSAMQSKEAPRPITGSSRGGKYLWGRDQVVAYWERIAAEGLPADVLEAVQ